MAAIGLGLRQGELLGLRWADVDLDAGTVTVRHTRNAHDKSLAEPKTNPSGRSGRALSCSEVLVSRGRLELPTN
jgi:integrase